MSGGGLRRRRRCCAMHRDILEARRSAALAVRNAIIQAANLLLAAGVLLGAVLRRGANCDDPHTDDRDARQASLRIAAPTLAIARLRKMPAFRHGSRLPRLDTDDAGAASPNQSARIIPDAGNTDIRSADARSPWVLGNPSTKLTARSLKFTALSPRPLARSLARFQAAWTPVDRSQSGHAYDLSAPYPEPTMDGRHGIALILAIWIRSHWIRTCPLVNCRSRRPQGACCRRPGTPGCALHWPQGRIRPPVTHCADR